MRRKDAEARPSEDDLEPDAADLGLEPDHGDDAADLGLEPDEHGDEDSGEDGEEPGGGRKRHWWSRRRDVDDEFEEAPDDDEDTGPDWNAVVADSRADGEWLDWSAPALPDEGAVVEPAASSERSPDGATEWGPAPEPAEPIEPVPSALLAAEETVAVWETKTDPAPTADAPAVAAAVATDDDEESRVRYRSTPSWPPPPRPRIAAGIVCTLIAIVLVVLLVTNGYIGEEAQEASSNTPQARPALRTDPNSVPNDWVVYRHAGIEFGLSYPPGWTVNEQGSVIEIRDPAANTGLRIDHRKPPGKTDPHEVFRDEERTSSTRLTDYRHLQLAAASYLGHDAALWEYTFSENGQFRHAADLGFVTEVDRFRMSFEAGSADWERMLPVFQGFLSSFRPPR